MELTPATEAERRHLAFQRGGHEARGSHRALRQPRSALHRRRRPRRSRRTAAPRRRRRTRAGRVYEKFFKKQRKDLKTNLQLRLLQDLLEKTRPATPASSSPTSTARSCRPAFALVDPGGLVNQFSSDVGGETVALYVAGRGEGGLWYLAHTKKEIAAGRLPAPAARADAEHYAIETTIPKNTRIRGIDDDRASARASRGCASCPWPCCRSCASKEAVFSRARTPAPGCPPPSSRRTRRRTRTSPSLFPEPLPAGKRRPPAADLRGRGRPARRRRRQLPGRRPGQLVSEPRHLHGPRDLRPDVPLPRTFRSSPSGS